LKGASDFARIAISDRALPTLFRAVAEFFGIDQNEFAS
jgi:hypothetical protein